MSKKDDPNEGLADDASLATDLGDEDERRAEQQEYYGGDPEEDTEDLSNLDRGDAFDEDDDGQESEEESEEGSQDAEESAESDDDAEELSTDDEDAEDESADDSDQDDSESTDDSDEDSEDSDEEEEVEEEEEEKPKGIPRRRFNEVNQRMKDAEAELARRDAEAKAGDDAKVEKFNFDAKEEEYQGLLLDGKIKEATALRREIRAAEKAEFMAEAISESTESVAQTATDEALDSLSKEAERMFPIFDADSDDFNPAAVAKTMTFMRGYQAEGMKDDDAFVAALADMIEMYDLDTESQSDDATEESEEAEAEKPGKKVTKKKAIKKTRDKIKAEQQQGKSPVGEGKGSSDAGAVVPDIEQMSDEELDALPDATMRRMRGDEI